MSIIYYLFNSRKIMYLCMLTKPGPFSHSDFEPCKEIMKLSSGEEVVYDMAVPVSESLDQELHEVFQAGDHSWTECLNGKTGMEAYKVISTALNRIYSGEIEASIEVRCVLLTFQDFMIRKRNGIWKID